MKAREEEEKRQARALSAQDKCWSSLTVPEGMGVETARYKFRQNQVRKENLWAHRCSTQPVRPSDP